MADDDNFDIDIYGDDAPQDSFNNNTSEVKNEAHEDTLPDASSHQDSNAHSTGAQPESREQSVKQGSSVNGNGDDRQQISSTGGSSHNQLQPPKQAPVQQGVKRKEGADDRPVDSNATTALLISDLHWWTNEDDIRGWANQSGCEDELVDVTFNEHKVNGKSKGQCFVEMASPQAATALKHTIESFGQGQQYAKKHSASYHAPNVNPYRTLPKDVPNRKDGGRSDNRSSSGSFGGSGMNNNFTNNSSGFRGGRGGFNNRGGMNNMGYNNRGGFNGPMTGGGMGPGGGFGGGPMGGFGGGPMGGMNNMGFNNFNRGGMMGGGMRGGMANRGRGGMNGGMNAGMMGGMGPMGGMGGMGMNPGMMGGMGGNMNMGMGGMQGEYTFSQHGNQHRAQQHQHHHKPNNRQHRQRGIEQHQQRPSSSKGGAQWQLQRSRQNYSTSSISSNTRHNTPSHNQLLHWQPGLGFIPGNRSSNTFVNTSLFFAGGFGGGPQPHFNPNFFGNQQSGGGGGGGGDGNWNPHGAKRPRPE